MRAPRLTFVSDGKPRRRLLVGLKAKLFVDTPFGFHDHSFRKFGVADRIRTGICLVHSQALLPLSYDHH